MVKKNHENRGDGLAAMHPVNRSRVSDEVLVQLSNLIMDGAFKPGDKLPPERQLAEQFGVNRGSLREALRRLETMGMVFIRQGGGIFVQDFKSHAGLEFVSFIIQNGIHLDKKLILDMAEMRIYFGVMMLKLAAKNMNEKSLAALEASVEAIVNAEPGDRQSGELDFAFYYEIAKATENRIFVFILNTIRQVMSRVIGIYFGVTDNPTTSVKLYRGLLDALKNQDANKAIELFEKQARKDDQLLSMLLEGMN